MRKVDYDLDGHPKNCVCMACTTAREMIKIIRGDHNTEGEKCFS